MSWKSTAALLALSLFGVGSLVYLLLKKDEENEDNLSMSTKKATVVKVKVPRDSIGIIIGRGGNTIKDIESKADVKIKVTDDPLTNDYKICVIKGIPESVQYAELLIHEIIVSQPFIETYEMTVPAHACGRIIGKNGDNIRLICRNSNAKITIENTCTSPPDFERVIRIKGTSEQIELAKTLVEEKLEQEKMFRDKLENLVSNRPPRNKPKYLLPAKGEEKEETHQHKVKFTPTGSNGLLEAYVSAVESPDRFWLQMMGSSTVELDRLSEQMTEYYSNYKNKLLHKLEEVKNGQIVAAPFTFDNKWYRAEVVEVQNTSQSENEEVLLYYVDYGNSSRCKKNSIYELRTDFLRLRFQAIECMLAKVKPRDSTWSEEATDVFEDLTHSAMWKSLLAKIHTYKERSTRVTREGSPIPCVDLYDTHGDKTINIAEELVERGFAVWDTEDPSPTTEKQKPVNGKSPGTPLEKNNIGNSSPVL